jgi:parallel beta-helix repeat protein
MKSRFVVAALTALCIGALGVSQAIAAPTADSGSTASKKKSGGKKKGGKKKNKVPKSKTWEVCKHGCKYKTIQKAVDAAGSYKAKKKYKKVKAYVKIKPGKYVEGVVLDGTKKKKNFDGLTIAGINKNAKKAILEGKNAKGELGPAQNGIEAVDVNGLVLKNMWARNYESNGFFVHAATQTGQECDGYTMNNLLASANRSYGLFAKGCLGGKMINSAGYHHGDSAFYVGETPCDSTKWTNHEIPAPVCQKKPKWTVLKNDVSYENVLGFSGTNSKYVEIVDSDFYNNGLGIAPNTLDSEGYEPNGWMRIERNNVFWNNYNYFLAGSAFHTVSGGLGKVGSATVNYPTGVGIVLMGSDGNIVKNNNIFGNYKWGIASFSAPGEIYVANEGDDAKNVNNQIVENAFGRDGTDPNGEYDIWDDASGGGNCWSGNSGNPTFAPGNGKESVASIYPPCPQPTVYIDQVSSLNIGAGLQLNPSNEADPTTILGYAGASPPQTQECSWVRKAAHPAFESFAPVEVAPAPGEVTCPK